MASSSTSSALNARIGWIGIGRMGYAMAERLAKAGADLTVWNRTRPKAEPLAARTLQPAGCADGGVGRVAVRRVALSAATARLSESAPCRSAAIFARSIRRTGPS